ncbi:hypothetical protein GCM10027521_36620 [Amycolatopsis cihanbeyliensis]
MFSVKSFEPTVISTPSSEGAGRIDPGPTLNGTAAFTFNPHPASGSVSNAAPSTARILPRLMAAPSQQSP